MKRRWYLRGIPSLIVAGLLAWFGWHFREYGLKLGWEPQKLSAADLVAKGPGDNWKVELTGYHISEPVIETFKDGQTVQNAWFPLYVQRPANLANPKEIPPIFYHRAAGDTRTEFEALRRQLVVRGVVANEFEVFPDKPTEVLRRAYPGLDKVKVIYIRDSSIPLQWLVYIAGSGAAMLGLFGTFCLVKARRASSAAEPEAEAPGPSLPPRQSTDAVPVYRAAPHELPPEIVALGRADQIHKPSRIYTIGKEQPVPIVLAGLVTLGIGLMLASTLPLAGNVTLVVIVTVVVLLGVGMLALPFLNLEYVETYLVYPDALVVMRGDTFSLIRWGVIKELNSPRVIVTSDGQSFGLAMMNEVENLGRLYDRVREEVSRRLLPPALAVLEAGDTLTFGKFTISKSAIGYDGKSLPWDRVGQVGIAANPRLGLRHITVKEQGRLLGSTLSGDLNAIPNDWLFLEVVRRLCPPHLLVTPVN